MEKSTFLNLSVFSAPRGGERKIVECAEPHGYSGQRQRHSKIKAKILQAGACKHCVFSRYTQTYSCLFDMSLSMPWPVHATTKAQRTLCCFEFPRLVFSLDQIKRLGAIKASNKLFFTGLPNLSFFESHDHRGALLKTLYICFRF